MKHIITAIALTAATATSAAAISSPQTVAFCLRGDHSYAEEILTWEYIAPILRDDALTCLRDAFGGDWAYVTSHGFVTGEDATEVGRGVDR